MKLSIILVPVVFLLLLSPLSASASFYRYYDDTGGVNVTNDYQSIPERYRAQATIIPEKGLEHRVTSRDKPEQPNSGHATQKQRQAVPVAPLATGGAEPAAGYGTVRKEAADPPVEQGWLARQLPLLKVMGIAVLLVCGFIVVGRVASALAPRSLAIVIKIAMLAAIAIFVTKGFADKVVDAFAHIKEASGVAQKAVDKRSEKIQQQAE